MSNLARALVLIFVLSALLGAVFAGISTYDFVQHLDRQVHGAHCSFIPGLAGDHAGSSGCDVALMSPYSSIFRTWVWGGLPVSLPGLALFIFLTSRGASLLFARAEKLASAAVVLVGWSMIASLTSVVMGAIAIFALDTLCKSCLGIYAASFVCLFSSVAIVFAGDGAASKWEEMVDDSEPFDEVEDVLGPVTSAVAWSLAGGVFVLAPCLLYLVLVPDFGTYIGTCGALEEREDRYGVLIPLHPQPGGIETIEVFDPLCPACKGLEERLSLSGQAPRLDRKVVLFPLDDSCNWMLSDAIHPGACATSEAILCAEDPVAVVDWSFAHQDEIMEVATAGGDKAVYKRILQDLPALKGCLGSAKTKQMLNRSLRWTVANSLKVLTPQVFIEGVAMCEEDTDLGLAFTLAEMVDRAEKKTLKLEEAP